VRGLPLALIGLVGGFLVGLAWGRGTRGALPDVTTTRYEGGVLTVRVDTLAALRQGLRYGIQGRAG